MLTWTGTGINKQDDPGGLRLCSARIILAFSLIMAFPLKLGIFNNICNFLVTICGGVNKFSGEFLFAGVGG